MKAAGDTDFRVRSSYERALAPGETLFAEGDAGQHLYVIQSGEIELTREGPSGHRVVARLSRGDFFGEVSAVSGRPRSARAVAVKATRVLQLDRDTLESMCVAQPEIAIRMIRILVARLVEAERRLAVLGVDDLVRPVVRSLLRDAQRDASGSGFRIPTTLRRIADQAGLSLPEAHRALHQLFEGKLLQLTDDCLIAPDLEALSGCLEPAER